MEYLVFEDKPKYDLVLKLIVGGVLALTFVLGIILIFADMTGAIAIFLITLFDAVLFWVIVPRNYRILQDRIKIVLGGPFAMNLPFSTIDKVQASAGSKAFFYTGLRMAPSSSTVVEIVRSKGINIVISPQNRGLFLEQANRALQAWRAQY